MRWRAGWSPDREGGVSRFDAPHPPVATLPSSVAARPRRVGANAALALAAGLCEMVVDAGRVSVVRDGDVAVVAVAALTDAELIEMISPMEGELE